jgi:putative salt-induced outer membrane protein YdiY
MAARDRDALDRLLTEDFVLRGNPDVGREAWLTNAVSLCWGDRFSVDRPAVIALDDAAVVSFVLTFYSDPSTCTPGTLRSLVTDVWRLEAGAWRLAVRHSGPLGPSGVTAQFEIVQGPPPPFEARGELSFVSTGGNASTGTLGFSADAIHRAGRGTTTGRGRFITAEADGVESARSSEVQVRHGRRVSPRIELFGRGAYLRDLFAGIEHRVEGTGGVTLTVSSRPHALTVDGGVGMTSETRLGAPDDRFASGNVAANYVWTLTNTSYVSAETSFVADLEQAPNWRVSNDVSLLAGLNSVLAARLSFGTRYVNRPVPGFRRTDRTVSAALVIAYVRRAAVPLP